MPYVVYTPGYIQTYLQEEGEARTEDLLSEMLFEEECKKKRKEYVLYEYMRSLTEFVQSIEYVSTLMRMKYMWYIERKKCC